MSSRTSTSSTSRRRGGGRPRQRPQKPTRQQQRSLDSFFRPRSSSTAATAAASAAAKAAEAVTSTADGGVVVVVVAKKRRRVSAVVDVNDDKSSRFGTCPLCGNRSVPVRRLEMHAATCRSSNTSTESRIGGVAAACTSGSEEEVEEEDVVVSTATTYGGVGRVGGDDSSNNDDDDDGDGDTTGAATKQEGRRHRQQQSDGVDADGAVVVVATAATSTTTTNCCSTGSAVPLPLLPAVIEPLPGLFLFEEFITPQEESRILAELGTGGSGNDDGGRASRQPRDEGTGGPPSGTDRLLPWTPCTFNGRHLGKKWGVQMNLRDRTVEPASSSSSSSATRRPPMPDFLNGIVLPRLSTMRQMKGCVPNEANAILYARDAGHYLAAHVDDRQLSKEPIANLSLAGDCYMTFRRAKKSATAASAKATGVPPPFRRVLLKRRTLQIMTGKSRYEYTHAIDNLDLLSDRRISITMRESPLTTTAKSTTATASGGSNNSKKGVRVAPPSAVAAASSAWWKKRIAKPPTVPAVSTKSMSISGVDEILPSDQPIPGLFLFDEFITEDEENAILRELDGVHNDDDGAGKVPQHSWKLERHTGLQREKRYGVDHDLWNQDVREPKHEMPAFFHTILLPKLRRISVMVGCTPNDANALEYRRALHHSLKAHVDDRRKHKEPIANLSLAGDCYMVYRNEQRHRNLAAPYKKVLLKRRCLQVLTGTARYDFSHGIESSDLLSDRRVSFTMRETPIPSSTRPTPPMPRFRKVYTKTDSIGSL